jgi:hypothetical protein
MREATRSVFGLQYIVIFLGATVAACAPAQAPGGSAVKTTTASAQVAPGIEVLLSGDMASLRGLRVGLNTNHTGKLRDIAHDPHVNLAYYTDRTREWISVSGLATISRDRQKIHELYAADW